MEMSVVSAHNTVGEIRWALANIRFLFKVMFCDIEIARNFAMAADVL